MSALIGRHAIREPTGLNGAVFKSVYRVIKDVVGNLQILFAAAVGKRRVSFGEFTINVFLAGHERRTGRGSDSL